MKPRQPNPQPELVRMRTFRLDSPEQAPKIDFDSLLSSSMTLNSINGHIHSPPTTPNHRQNGYSPAPSSYLTPTATNADGTPTRAPTSPSPSGTLSPLLLESESPKMNPSRHLSSSDPPVESPDPWSSAVGRATLGKSGRVIERLMGENDKLKRDKNLATVKLEEELRRGESASAALDSLRTTNEHLMAIHDADKAALARRDRKLEELKADLLSEKSRREKAEAEVKNAGHERDEAVKFYKKETLEAQEWGGKAVAEHRILLQSWNGLEEGYKRQTEDLACTMQFLRKKRVQDLELLARRDATVEQLQQGLAKTQKANDAIVKLFADYRKMKEDSLEEFRERAERSEKANEELAKTMAEVVGEMKYVMNVKRDVRGAE